MEAFLTESLGRTGVRRTGKGGGGCISQGKEFRTDQGNIFVKMNDDAGARDMFLGEQAGLEEIEKTQTVRVPHPTSVLDSPSGPGAMLVMEMLSLSSCSSSSLQSELGKALGGLHLANRQAKGTPDYVDQFGFRVATCCGSLVQGNQWSGNWSEFYTSKLEEQVERQEMDRELYSLWPQLRNRARDMLGELEVQPSLLHGDLWSGNVGRCDGRPVVFDPASFYGHSEFDLAIAGMFGGFSGAFYAAYHKLMPKQEGFERRQELYQLFHYLKHWNMFGTGYRGQSMAIIKRLIK